MKKFLTIAMTALFTIGLSVSVTAQTQMSVEKRALITELIGVLKMEDDMVKTVDVMLDSMELFYPSSVRKILEKDNIFTDAEVDRMEKEILAKSAERNKKFKERWTEYVNVKEYIEASAYMLYDKYYTEGEIKDLIVFYRSAAGQKMLQVSPDLTRDAMKLSAQMLIPQVAKLSEDLMKEEVEIAKAKLPKKGAKRK